VTGKQITQLSFTVVSEHDSSESVQQQPSEYLLVSDDNESCVVDLANGERKKVGKRSVRSGNYGGYAIVNIMIFIEREENENGRKERERGEEKIRE
jgi:hypothetical protein